jgi:hypothetical protein
MHMHRLDFTRGTVTEIDPHTPPKGWKAARSRAKAPPRVACRLRGWSWRTGRADR